MGRLGSLIFMGVLALTTALQSAVAQVESPRQEGDVPNIRVSESVWDFGAIPRGAEAVHSFEVENTGSAELRIRVRSSCGCLRVDVRSDTLAPNESVRIKATFREDRRLGKTNRTIYIDSNDPDEPRKTLRVTGIVTEESPEAKTKPPGPSLEGQLQSGQAAPYAAPGESPGEQPMVEFLLFGSEDCDDCAAIKDELIPRLRERFQEALEPKYHSVDAPGNYDLLVGLEEHFQSPGNPIPVVFIGDHVLGGRKEIAENLEHLIEHYLSTGGTEFPSVTPAKREEGAGQDREVYLAYFFSPGCRQCDRVHYMLNSLEQGNPALKIRRFNSELKESTPLHEALCELFGVPEERRLSVPSIFVGEVHLVQSEITDSAVRGLIERYRNLGTRAPWEDAAEAMPQAERSLIERFKSLGPLTVAAAGLIDGVNPCAFATIIFLISYLSLIGRKGKELVYVGLAFAAAVFATYFLVGLGIFRFIHVLGVFSLLSRIIYLLTAVLAFVLGVLSFRDFLRIKRGRGDEVTLELPKFLKNRIHTTIRKSTRSRQFVLAAFAAGAIVSLLELECTGQVYLPTISFVVRVPELRAHAVFYLLLYNVMFILPLVAIFGLTYFGTTWEQFSAVMRNHLASVKLVTAVFFFGLSALLVATLL